MERKQTPEKKTLKKSNTNTTSSKIRPDSAKKPALEITRFGFKQKLPLFFFF